VKSYGLTELGRRQLKRSDGGGANAEEVQLLQFIKSRHIATEDEIEAYGGDRFLARRLKSEGYIVQLSSGD